MDPPNIQLVDNTAPVELRLSDDAAISKIATTATDLSRNSSRLWGTRPSIRGELTRRKYAKWQPDRLGVADSDQPSSSNGGRLSVTNTYTNTTASTAEGPNNDNDNSTNDQQSTSAQSNPTGRQEIESRESERDHRPTNHQSPHHPKICGLKPNSEIDILYENQRGWFFFGIPLYSQQSLLNLDPPGWMTPDWRASLVNITNAQVPDPSWEWVWRAWYVDMSGDVDDQGWQYAFSFGSSSWRGIHPFWHSFVRRRRWVRLRVKRASSHPNQAHDGETTGFEMAHRLNEDYFTIHSSGRKTRRDIASLAPSGSLSRGAASTVDEVVAIPDEIKNIPTLMFALKVAIVDREKLDAVKKFIEQGGEELYYLDGKIPEIMGRFIYQYSRWLLLTHIQDTLHGLSHKAYEESSHEAEEERRKLENLQRVVETARHHLRGPEVFHGPSEIRPPGPAPMTSDLTPASKKNSLLSRYSGRFTFKPMDNGGSIKGIPRKAEIGREGHIY